MQRIFYKNFTQNFLYGIAICSYLGMRGKVCTILPSTMEQQQQRSVLHFKGIYIEGGEIIYLFIRIQFFIAYKEQFEIH